MLRALVVLCWLGGIAVAADPPAPTKWVTDNVSFLSPAASSALDEQLRNYEARTHHQVIVWIGAALEGNEPIDDFAARVFKAWGIGRKHADDGVALFVIPATHDTRIEVGYGLEPQLADLAASHILTETVVPELRAGHADAAIQKGVDQILAKLDANGGAELQATPGDTSSGLTWWEIILLVIGGIALLAFAITRRMSRAEIGFAMMPTSGGLAGVGLRMRCLHVALFRGSTRQALCQSEDARMSRDYPNKSA